MSATVATMPPSGAYGADAEKFAKLRNAILLGLLVIAGIAGWHIYEHLIHGGTDGDHDSAIVHDIVGLTQRLFHEEQKQQTALLESVNLQGKTKAYAKDDHASQQLLQLNHALLEADPDSTVYLMRRLFDNYELDTHAVEKVSPDEAQEELDFLNAVLKTPIVKQTMKFLQQKSVVSADHRAQLQLLKDIWFTQYSRGHGRVGSSGFEHVFLAELKDQNILGLHNWLYFGEQERAGHIDYMGYIDRIDLDKHNHYLLAIRFTFHGIVKPYNTLFVGTSPELELSLYTVCFLLSAGQPCPVQLGAARFSIITHSWDWNGRKTLAAAYPSIEKLGA